MIAHTLLFLDVDGPLLLPFAWVDDELTDADRDWVPVHHRGPALLRSIDASRGLTDQDFAVLEVWLRELPRTARGDPA